jgi:hypothetical protein
MSCNNSQNYIFISEIHYRNHFDKYILMNILNLSFDFHNLLTILKLDASHEFFSNRFNLNQKLRKTRF